MSGIKVCVGPAPSETCRGLIAFSQLPVVWAVSGSPWLAAARLQSQSLGSHARLPKWACLPVAICLGREACQTKRAPCPTMTPS